jgi:ribosomal-protein-alanine N-acetyltransferase
LARGAKTMFLEVRPSNARALRLYRKAGFAEVGTRPGYYPAHDGKEDALILAMELSIAKQGR